MQVIITALQGIPEINEGGDIASEIIKALEFHDIVPEDEDIFVIAQKIVSKTEGRVLKID